MVYHIGIDPVKGWCSIFNEESKKIESLLVGEIGPDDINKFEELFKEIKAKINSQIGCTCVFLDFNYPNKIRKKFIESGKQHGFLKIQIVYGNTIFYLEAAFNTKCKPNLGDIIWILTTRHCMLWEKTNTKVKLLDILSFDTISNEDILNEIKKKFCRGEPNIIIIGKVWKNTLNTEIIKKVFLNCKLLMGGERIKDSEFALLKARIMAKDIEVLEYDTFNQLQRNAIVKINDKIFMNFKRKDFLPLEKTAFLPIGDDKLLKIVVWLHTNNDAIEFFSEEKKVTFEMFIAGEISFTLKIDENHICSIKFELNESTEIINLKAFYSKSFPQTYKIPEKFLINNSNIKAVGVDLGTSRCCAAVNRRNGIETVVLDNTGERLLPSYVSFNKETDKCGQIVVDQLQLHSKSTVFDSKRIIGKDYFEIEIDPTWPYDVINLNNKPLLKLYCHDQTILKNSEEVAAVLLKHIKQKIEEFQGKRLSEVVITVPAAFTENQKFATHIAGIFAGWKTVHLLPEPVAATIAYFVERPIPNNFIMLLFDFGGGTLDVCIFKVDNFSLQIISQKGDNNLGGRDFDNLLFYHLLLILKDQYNISVNVKDKLKYKLMQKCVAIKHALSVEKETLLDVSDFDGNIEDTLAVTRAKFESMAKELLNKVKNLIIEALTAANYITRDINSVLLAGGSCRMPMIKHLLQTMFTKASHCCEENPDEVVAIGAAYYAYYLSLQEEKQKKRDRNLGEKGTGIEKKKDCSII